MSYKSGGSSGALTNPEGGYGTTVTKGAGKTWSAADTYPYTASPRYPIDAAEDDVDDDDVISRKRIFHAIDFNDHPNISPPPPPDRGSVTKSRMDLSVLESWRRLDEEASAPVMSGMIPFPFKALYGRAAGGPALGGVSNDQSYRTGPGHFIGTQWGTSHGVPDASAENATLRVSHLQDMLDPDVRAVVKQQLRHVSVTR